MNITVYCGSNYGKDPAYKEGAYALGQWIGRMGHSLVYGGSGVGLMKEVCDGAADNGARIYGIEPGNWLKDLMYEKVTDKIYTDTVAERKTRMIELGDVYIALPGGPGTLDEITEVIELSILGDTDCPIILYDTLGYYSGLKSLFDQMKECGFMSENALGKVLISDDLRRIEEFIEKK